MSLDDRLRKLEAQAPPDAAPSPFVEWAETLPIDDVRTVRDYLRAVLDSASEDSLADDRRYVRARELLALAPALS